MFKFFKEKEIKDRYGDPTGKTEMIPNWWRIIPSTIVAVFVFFTFLSMFNSVQMGYTAVYQNAVTGKSKIYHGPDFIIKPPFVANITEYKKDTTLSFAPHSDEDFSSINDPIKVAFADTYKAKLIVNARMVLPSTDEEMLSLHEAFRNYQNLVNSLYNKTMVDVAVNTATQFTAEEIFQGGLNGLKSAIEDQSNLGVYVTERRKVRGESGVTERADAGDKKTASAATHKEVYIWKAIPIVDRNGKVKRTKNPLTQYGVQVTQVNLAEPIPEPLLEKLLNTKKTLVAQKIASIQKQENAKTNIETAKLEGEAERVVAEQKQLVKADAEIIILKKEVKVAEQQALKEIVEQQKLADLAKIDKAKELQMASDNEGIQAANERAAKYEAQAKLHNGLADAEITKAKYLAIREDILLLEVERATQLAKYQALKTATINMPTTVMNSNGGTGSEGGNLQELTNLHIMEKLK